MLGERYTVDGRSRGGERGGLLKGSPRLCICCTNTNRVLETLARHSLTRESPGSLPGSQSRSHLFNSRSVLVHCLAKLRVCGVREEGQGSSMGL